MNYTSACVATLSLICCVVSYCVVSCRVVTIRLRCDPGAHLVSLVSLLVSACALPGGRLANLGLLFLRG